MILLLENFFSNYLIYNIFCFLNICILLLIIFSINPIFSISYLIIFFFINFMILICFHVEFLAITFLVIYAGAISVLFIFIILLFDIKFLLLFDRKTLDINLVLLIITCLYLISLFIFNKFSLFITDFTIDNIYSNWFIFMYQKPELEHFGKVLYNYYYFHVFWVIFGLFITMLGIIILSMNKHTIIIKKNFIHSPKNFKKLFFLLY